MYSSRSTLFCRLFLIASAILPVSCFKDLTVNTTLYENNFQKAGLKNLEVAGWDNNTFSLVKDVRISDYNGSKVLGKLNNNQVMVAFYKLPAHTEIRVDLILNLHNNWKNDLWSMRFDDMYLLTTGFSNNPAIQQSYPGWLGNSSLLYPAGANATNTELPGVCTLVNNTRGTSQYHIVITFRHEAYTGKFICNDAGGVYNDTCQRSWSLSNLKISALRN